MAKVEIEVGKDLRSALGEVATAWNAAARGEPVEPTVKLCFVDLDFAKLPFMTDAEERQFMDAFTRELEADCGEEAQRRLDAGLPIYYADDRFEGVLVKEFPDGRRQLVTFEGDTEVFVRDL